MHFYSREIRFKIYGKNWVIMGKIHGKNSWEKFMGKIQTVGKGGACSMGKLKYFFFPGTYTRSASELDRAWLVTMLRKKKRVMGNKHGKYGKNWVLVGKRYGKYGKNWVIYGEKNRNMGKIG